MIIQIVIGIYCVCTVLYGMVLIMLRYGFVYIPELKKSKSNSNALDRDKHTSFISVLIPVRNEENGIIDLLNDLTKQTIEPSLFEVLVIDDHSTDNTADLVQEFIAKHGNDCSVKMIALPEGSQGKKAAITLGVKSSVGQWIVQTDGDCRVSPEWMESYIPFLEKDSKTKFISGPVQYHNRSGWFARFQQLEFLALIGIGASSIRLNMPNMSNAANMCYSKEVFNEVGGHNEHAHVASGDDEFLLKKIHRNYADGIVFLKDQRAIVRTEAKHSLKGFMMQRIRWAGKWKQHGWSSSSVLPVLLFLYYTSIAGMAVSSFYDSFACIIFGAGIVVKVVGEYYFYQPVLRFFRERSLGLFIIPMQLLYPVYALVVGLLSFKKRYVWKGRQLS